MKDILVKMIRNSYTKTAKEDNTIFIPVYDILPSDREMIADFIEQQAKQIQAMKCCTNCKHGGGRWCELEGCINLNKWDGGSE